MDRQSANAAIHQLNLVKSKLVKLLNEIEDIKDDIVAKIQ